MLKTNASEKKLLRNCSNLGSFSVRGYGNWSYIEMSRI